MRVSLLRSKRNVVLFLDVLALGASRHPHVVEAAQEADGDLIVTKPRETGEMALPAGVEGEDGAAQTV